MYVVSSRWPRYGASIIALPGGVAPSLSNGTVTLAVKTTEMTPEVAMGKALVEMFDQESPMVGGAVT